jgi:hypothetical protein
MTSSPVLPDGGMAGSWALPGAPPTAVMTSNLTRFVLDVGEVLLGREGAAVAKASQRACPPESERLGAARAGSGRPARRQGCQASGVITGASVADGSGISAG